MAHRSWRISLGSLLEEEGCDFEDAEAGLGVGCVVLGEVVVVCWMEEEEDLEGVEAAALRFVGGILLEEEEGRNEGGGVICILRWINRL